MKPLAYLVGLALVAAVAGCGSAVGAESGTTESGTTAEAECDTSTTSPVTVYELVDVFRAEGISLEVNRLRCESPEASIIDATNAGRDGLSSDPAVSHEQGDILCRLFEASDRSIVETVHYVTDDETYVSVLNVQCAVYPSAPERAETQIEQVKTAMQELARRNQGGNG